LEFYLDSITVIIARYMGFIYVQNSKKGLVIFLF